MKKIAAVLVLLIASLTFINPKPFLAYAANEGNSRGFWHFNEGTGTIAYDSSGNANNGALHGGSTWADGRIGKALSLDGTSGYVEVPDSDSLDVTGKLTLEAWIYPKSLVHAQVIVCKYNHSSLSSSYYLSLGGTLGTVTYLNKIYFALTYNGNNYYSMVSNANITANTWTHVAATSNATHMSIYINGVKDKVRTYPPGVVYAGSAKLRIGCYLPEAGYPRLFHGLLDDVRVAAGVIWTVDDDKAQCPNADFSKIQDAVDAAGAGDTVLVHTGAYVENVNIPLAVTLKSMSRPVIDGNQAGTCLTIAADCVTIDGFELRNGTNGIFSYGTDRSVVSNNLIHDILNIPGNAGCGIMFWSDSADFDNNTINNNEIYDCDRQGIYIGGETSGLISEGNTISENKIYNNGLYTYPNGPDASAYGVQLSFADSNFISNNEIYGHDDWFAYPDFDFAQGIYLFDSNANLVANNYLHDNNYGVGLYHYWRPVGINHLHYNNIQSNTGYGVLTFDGLPEVDARFNWWGSASGPTHASNTGGAGDEIGDNIDYSPWLGATSETEPRTYHVNPTGTIQEAIDEANAGDTILVHEGTYEEAIVISKSLTLRAASKPVIKAPDTRKTYTIAENTAAFDPVIFAYGGTETGGSVSGSATVSVTVDGFEIDGGNKAGTSARFVAILYRNVKPGTVSNNNIRSMYDSDAAGNGPQTFGILVYGDSDVTIQSNEVRDFSRGGIGVAGDTGTLPDPHATVEHNAVFGNGLESGTNWWAENGIQIGFEASGIVLNNTVTDCQVNNPSWVSTGIMIYNAMNGANVLNNTVTECDTGIAAVSPSYDVIAGNVVHDCNWDGIRLGWPVDHCTVTNNAVWNCWAGIGVWDASDNTITNNAIDHNEYGIIVDGDSNNNVIAYNVIRANSVDGILVEPYGVDPSGTEVHYNNITDNGAYGIEKTGTAIVNATANWWGDDTGPFHNTTWTYMGDPYGPHLGAGDRVSDYVLYDPWLPLVTVVYVHDIAVTHLTATPDMVEIGDTVHITVTVKNVGNATETFNLITNYGGSASIEHITDLLPGNETTFTYDWDTMGEGQCFHTISALAGPVPGEKFAHDNYARQDVRLVIDIPPPVTVRVEPQLKEDAVIRGTPLFSVTLNDLDAYWDLAGFDMKLRYNATMIEATEVQLGAFAKQFNLTYRIIQEIDNDEGLICIAYMWDFANIPLEQRPTPYGSGVLFTVEFSVKEVGTCSIELNDVMLAAFGNSTKWCTESPIPINFVAINGAIRTIPVLKEDVNADGRINIYDIVMACASYASYPGHPKWNPYADIDGDGRITIFDLVSITRLYGLVYGDP